MIISYYIVIYSIFLSAIAEKTTTKSRKRRYLIFTKDTQWGVYATVSVPIYSEAYVSVAWFYEASYYSVDNSTYLEPLLGDIYTTSRKRGERDITAPKDIITRSNLYKFIESNLERHGYPGRECLLRAICEHAEDHFLHNGILGDALYLTLTPSTSMSEEDIEDIYYEAEFYGMENNCNLYRENCKSNPLEEFSIFLDNS